MERLSWQCLANPHQEAFCLNDQPGFVTPFKNRLIKLQSVTNPFHPVRSQFDCPFTTAFIKKFCRVNDQSNVDLESFTLALALASNSNHFPQRLLI